MDVSSTILLFIQCDVVALVLVHTFILIVMNFIKGFFPLNSYNMNFQSKPINVYTIECIIYIMIGRWSLMRYNNNNDNGNNNNNDNNDFDEKSTHQQCLLYLLIKSFDLVHFIHFVCLFVFF